MLVSFTILMLCFFAIGIMASRKSKQSMDDYLLAGRTVHPWLAGLSALSSGQSAFLFTAQVGYAYSQGFAAIWLAIGWAFGDYLAWRWVYNGVRRESSAHNLTTVTGFIAHGCQHPWCRIIMRYCGLAIIILMSFYAAAQFVAGGKILHYIFEWPSYVGIITGACLVLAYCATGGIRASIWTDAVQTLVMLGSLLLLFITIYNHVGGLSAMTLMHAKHTSIIPDTAWGFTPFFVGWVVAGFGAIGQPHILVRGMSVADCDSVAKARNVKVVIGLCTAFIALFIGMLTRSALPELADPETALFAASQLLLPDILVGVMLAGFFAALISTADSQILAASAILSQDMLPRLQGNYHAARLTTCGVIAAVVAIALIQHASVFTLVTVTWSILAGSLGVGVLLVLFHTRPDSVALLIAMVTGPILCISWRYIWHFSPAMYEALPAMAGALLAYYITILCKRLIPHPIATC